MFPVSVNEPLRLIPFVPGTLQRDAQLYYLSTVYSYYRPQRSWGKVIFSEACVNNSVHGGGVHGFIRGVRGFIRGGHAWFYLGGMRGFIHGGCVVLFGGACVVLLGGHAWFYSQGAWFYLGGVWFYLGGHAWFYSGGACMVFSVFSDTMRYGQ